MECPSCAALVKNVQLHFTRNSKCADKIDTIHFQSTFAEFKKQKRRDNKNKNMQDLRARQKEESNEAYLAMKEKNRQEKQNSRERMKAESQESKRALMEKNKQDNQKSMNKKSAIEKSY